MQSQSQGTVDMFEADATVPLARKHDPNTSVVAAEIYTATTHAADKRLMFDVIKRFPGKTSAEYSRILKREGVDWYKAARMTTKRTSDLISAGHVRVGPSRKCTKTGRSAQTYFVTGVEQ